MKIRSHRVQVSKATGWAWFLSSPPIMILALSLLAFSPCLLLGKAYFSNDLLQIFAINKLFLKEQLSKGYFPLWDPYLFGGQPFFADPNSTLCYPLNYLTLPFPVPYGFSVFFFLHLLLASFGMRFWLKGLGLTEGSSLVGAILFSFSGFFWWQLVSPPLISSFCWSPWLLGCIGKAVKDWSPRWSFLAGLCFAAIFCCGHIQSATYIFYAGFAYFIYSLLRRPKEAKGKGGKPWKKWGIALLFSAWGTLPLLVQLIPAHEFFDLSYRRNPVLTYDNFNATFSMPPSSLSQFLFPSLGVPEGTTLEKGIVQFDDQDPYKDNRYFGVQGYLGIWAPFLCILAFFQKDRKRAWFLACMGLVSALTALGHYFPLHRLECLALPWMGLSRAPNRFMEIYVLFAAALAAVGFENLHRFLSTRKSSRFLMAAGIYACGLFVVAWGDPHQTWMGILGLGLGIGGLWLWHKGKSLKGLGQGLFATALVLPLLLNGLTAFSTGPVSNFDLQKNFPALSYLEKKNVPGRYLFDPDLTYVTHGGDQTFVEPFPRNAPMDFDVRSTGGNEGFFLQKSFDLTLLPGPLYLKLMAVQGLVWKHPMPESKDIDHHSFPGCEVYEPLVPPPFVNAPQQVQMVSNDDQALALMKVPGFDPAKEVVLSESLPLSVRDQLIGKKATVTYSLLNDDPDEKVFKVGLDQDSLLVFSEIMYPGWKAYLDGAPTPLYTGDYAFRTVFVPTGEHRVEFRFEPAWAKPLFAGLLLWLVSVLIFGLYLWWTRTAPPRKMGHA